MNIGINCCGSDGKILGFNQINPDIKVKEAIARGFNVAKAVLGTMTTTLLLA